MTGLVNILVVIAVMALVIGRQMQARRLETERRFWLLPLILVVVALRDPQMIDRAHQGAAVALLAVSLLLVLAMGSVWGWTIQLWQDEDGAVWARGTQATAAAWAGMLAIRLGLFGVGAALHVRQSGSALLLGLAVLLLVRTLVVNWRARHLEPAYY
ncbi:DUF1453 family protein [Streptomyces sp. CB01881]|uniref:DUF1453 family protein n=1 Tax=Streptomyces sp. CB01881 TaxID=2078691 RepID=UPI000CDBCCCD|nr:DUF1453 family protein [Streptomyces sp. CB01881]AUY49584.1 DUF1453 domain-containing protein [Streptomyces sp. CB01881]TYC72978.1 DUF1453 family protein [Streptomyces sp. CB01881]